MEFEMPADLTGLSLTELRDLLAKAEAAFDELSAAATADGAVVSAADLERMQALNTAADDINNRIVAVEAEDAARAEQARQLIEARTARGQAAADPDEDDGQEDDPDDEGGSDGGASDVVAEAEQVAADAAEDQAVTASAGKTGGKTRTFKGLGARRGQATPPQPTEIGFRMRPQTPRYVDGPVGFRELALSLSGMATNSIVHPNRAPHRDRGAMVPLSLATLDRGFGEDYQIDSDDPEQLHEFKRQLVERTPWRPSEFDKQGALVASGGHCAVPETIYTFCDVTPASGLLTLPAANFGPRGGQRRPEEPDFTELYNTLPWRYTEEELQATNPDGTPVVTKPCIEIPCVEWEEVYVEAIGLCVTAGILQKRGFPEEVERFLKEVTKAHLIKVSLWSILDMVAVSNPYAITSGAVGAAGAFLSGLALRATLIRQQERLAGDALIEGVAPAWTLEVAKADMGFQQGTDVKRVTDADIDAWLAAKNIRMQWVQHWQALPVASVRWPSSVQALLYPAGAFTQHLANVIEVGTLYDKAQLQKNRYTELFTEDEYLVDKRCKVSEIVTVSLNASGSVGAREQITVATMTNEVQTATITGSPTGGTFTMTYKGKTTAALPYNASAAQVQAALAGLSTIGAGNVAVSGPNGGPYVITFQGTLAATNVTAITVTGSFSGGSSPAIAVAQTTAGSPN